MSSAPSSDDVPHQVDTAMLKQLAVIRYRPSQHQLLMPQAPSYDAVPHRSDDCQATPGAAVRCEQPNDNQALTPGHQRESGHQGGRQATPMLPALQHMQHHQSQQPKTVGGHVTVETVSRADASKKVATPAGAAIARPELDRVFTQRHCAVG
jgi:hypothetical protein